jgi:hypothetical protein
MKKEKRKQKYLVTVVRTLTFDVTVTAENEDDAKSGALMALDEFDELEPTDIVDYISTTLEEN